MAVREKSEYQRDRLGLMDDEPDTATAEREAADAKGDAALPIERKSGVRVSFVPARGRVVIEATGDIDPSHQPSHQPGVYSLQTFPVRCLPFFGP